MKTQRVALYARDSTLAGQSPEMQRDDISILLNSLAPKYSKSVLKSTRLVCQMVLGWAVRSGRIVRPAGWLENIKLPRKTGGRKVVRRQLEADKLSLSHLSGLNQSRHSCFSCTRQASMGKTQSASSLMTLTATTSSTSGASSTKVGSRSWSRRN